MFLFLFSISIMSPYNITLKFEKKNYAFWKKNKSIFIAHCTLLSNNATQCMHWHYLLYINSVLLSNYFWDQMFGYECVSLNSCFWMLLLLYCKNKINGDFLKILSSEMIFFFQNSKIQKNKKKLFVFIKLLNSWTMDWTKTFFSGKFENCEYSTSFKFFSFKYSVRFYMIFRTSKKFSSPFISNLWIYFQIFSDQFLLRPFFPFSG
jgi:hypothetical protein